jgi:hypothetical protein
MSLAKGGWDWTSFGMGGMGRVLDVEHYRPILGDNLYNSYVLKAAAIASKRRAFKSRFVLAAKRSAG